MAERLVEYLEMGWDLAIQCEGCGRRARYSQTHFVTVWAKYLNAPVGEIAKRLKCHCGAHGCRASAMGGTYAHFGMAGDYFNGRARWIRKALTDAGLDPAAYGYPPLSPEIASQPGAETKKPPPPG